MIYALIETGMRRAGVCQADFNGFDAKKRTLTVIEKGGHQVIYDISKDGTAAIVDYFEHERPADADARPLSPALFLPAPVSSAPHNALSPRMMSYIWHRVRKIADVPKDVSPHSARHAMGAHMAETGNPAAVKRQLNHKNAASSLSYMRPTKEKIDAVLDDRD